MSNATLNVGANSSNFNNAIKQMSAQLKVLKSDFNLTSTQAKLFGSAEDQLKAKQQSLNSIIQVQTRMVQTQQQKYDSIKSTLDSNKQKQQELQQKIQQTTQAYNQSVQATGRESRQSQQLQQELNNLQREYTQVDRAITNNISQMGNAETALNRTRQSLVENQHELQNVNNSLRTVNLDNVAKGFNKVSEGAKNVYDKTKGLSMAIIGLGAGATKYAADFESGMSQVAATMGYTTEQLHDSSSQEAQDFERLKDAAKEMGATTQFSATEASEALNYLALAGYDVDKSISTLPDVLNLAAAGGMELGTACDMVTDAASALGLTTDETTKLVDQMAKTSQKSNTSVSQLGEAILTVGGTANTLKGGMTEMNTALGELANVGIKGAEGGTHLRNVILSLSAPTDVAADALNALGVETTDASGNLLGLDEIMGQLNTKLSIYGTAEKAEWINKIFNKTDLTAVQGLMASTVKNVDELGSIMEQAGYKVEDHGRKMTDLQSAYDKTADDTTNLNRLMRQFEMSDQQAALALEALKSAAGDSSSWDKLRENIENSTGAADAQAKTMLDNLKGAIVLLKSALEGLGIQIGDILLPYIKSATTYVNNFVTWLSSLDETTQRNIVKFGLLVASIAPIALVISKVTGFIGSAIGVISTLIGFMVKFNIVGKLVTATQAAINVVMSLNPIGLIVIGVAALIAILVVLYNKCTPFREFVNNLASTLVTFFTQTLPQFFASIPEKLNSLWTTITTACSNGWNTVVNFFTVSIPAKLNELWNIITTACSNGWNAVVNFFTVSIPQMIENIGTWFAELPNKIAFALGQVVGYIASWIVECYTYLSTNIPMWIESIGNWFAELPGRIWNWLAETINNIASWGENMLTTATTWVSDTINAIGEWFSQLPGRIWEWLTQTISNLAEWGSNMLTTATTWVSNTINAVGEWFSQLPSRIWNWLVQTVTSLVTWGSNMLSTATSSCQQVVTGIVNTFKNLPSKMLEIGKNIVQGIKNGIKNAWNGMTGWLGGLCDSFIDGVKSKFDIHSPSRVMRDLIGKNIVLGMAEGLRAKSNVLMDTMDNICNGTIEVATDELDSYEDIGKAYIDSFKKGMEDRKENMINYVKYFVEKNVEALTNSNQENKELYKKQGEVLISEYTNAIKEGSDKAISVIDKTISKLSKEAQEKYSAVIKQQESMRSKLADYRDLFEEEDGEIELTNFKGVISNMEVYNEQLEALKNKNIPQELMNQILSMDIDKASAYMGKLLSVDDGEFSSYVNGFKKKQELAKTISENFYKEELDSIDKNFTNQLDTALSGMPEQMQNIGKNAMFGFNEGLQAEAQELLNNCKEIADNVTFAFKDAFDIHSPSRVFKSIGSYVAEGLGIGIDTGMDDVNKSIKGDLQNTINVSADMAKTKNNYNNVVKNSNNIVLYLDNVNMLDGREIGRETKKLVFNDINDMVRGLA